MWFAVLLSTVCPGTPPNQLTNGRFPTSCANALADTVCSATCNSGYGSPIAPTVACVRNTSSPTGASWSTSMNGHCDKGKLVTEPFFDEEKCCNFTECALIVRQLGFQHVASRLVSKCIRSLCLHIGPCCEPKSVLTKVANKP